jgi:hypothetical protein
MVEGLKMQIPHDLNAILHWRNDGRTRNGIMILGNSESRTSYAMGRSIYNLSLSFVLYIELFA